MPHNVQDERQPWPWGALLTKARFCELLAVSERKFDALQAAGIISQPLDLGPRAARWTRDDYETALAKLQRRARQPEPDTLSAGRRRYIERLKTGGV